MKLLIFLLTSFIYTSNISAKEKKEVYLKTLQGGKLTKEFCTSKKIANLRSIGKRSKFKAEFGIQHLMNKKPTKKPKEHFLVEEYYRLQDQYQLLKEKYKLLMAEYSIFSSDACRFLADNYQLTKTGETLVVKINRLLTTEDLIQLNKNQQILITKSNRLMSEFSKLWGRGKKMNQEQAQQLVPFKKKMVANAQNILELFTNINSIQKKIISEGFHKPKVK